MARSDYDLLAFNEAGEPCEGVMEGFLEGTSCEIYKNWLYVRDAGMWQNNRHYVSPTIAQIDEGFLIISDFEITATRGPQNAIFVHVVSARYHATPKGGPYVPPDVRRMVGIGCVGFVDASEIVREEEGLGPEWELEWQGSTHSEEGAYHEFFFTMTNDQTVKKVILRPLEDAKYEYKWCGVLPSTYDAFLTWLNDIDGSEGHQRWVELIRKSTPTRVNQGDLYFKEHMGIQPEATALGEAKAPLLHRLFTKPVEEE